MPQTLRTPLLRRPLPSARSTWSRLVVVAVAVAALTGAATLDAPTAQAAGYPSWSDVLAARGKESDKKTQITRLQGLIDGLSDRAVAAQQRAQQLGDAYAAAAQKAERAADTEHRLRAEAQEHTDTAERSAAQAGQYAAQLSRSGGTDMTVNLLADGAGARDLLYDLGALSKLTEQADRVGAAAANDAAVARSVTAQADRAAVALGRLAEAAERRMADAQEASDAAQAALDEQRGNEARLQAQLATLESGRVRTEAEFAKGEAERKAAEARAAAAAAAAARAAAARAASTGAPSGSVGSGSSGSAGAGSGSGWVRPGGGYVISPYGYRIHPITGTSRFHEGADLASGCSTAIVAAAAGTVDYVGWYGGYGNYVRIDHGGGVKTAYGHIVNGGFRVSRGQQVSAGQLIALVGSTGASTGCHLHVEVHLNGATTDPVPFLRARGVPM